MSQVKLNLFKINYNIILTWWNAVWGESLTHGVGWGKTENSKRIECYLSPLLNLIALFSDAQYQKFKKMDPYNQSISFNDGLYNRTAALDKDPKVAVYLLSNPDVDDIDYNIIP